MRRRCRAHGLRHDRQRVRGALRDQPGNGRRDGAPRARRLPRSAPRTAARSDAAPMRRATRPGLPNPAQIACCIVPICPGTDSPSSCSRAPVGMTSWRACSIAARHRNPFGSERLVRQTDRMEGPLHPADSSRRCRPIRLTDAGLATEGSVGVQFNHRQDTVEALASDLMHCLNRLSSAFKAARDRFIRWHERASQESHSDAPGR